MLEGVCRRARIWLRTGRVSIESGERPSGRFMSEAGWYVVGTRAGVDVDLFEGSVEFSKGQAAVTQVVVACWVIGVV